MNLTLRHFSQTDSLTISLIITDNDSSQQLNYQYRGINAPTDVLSFENIPDPDFPGFEQHHLGDIIIAYPVAAIQAQASGHTVMEEIILLAVHGIRHGQTRWNLERRLQGRGDSPLTELGLAHIQPTTD